MRVMVMVKATGDSEKGLLPTAELLEAMGRFNDELREAGAVFVEELLEVVVPSEQLAGTGDQASGRGSRRRSDRSYRDVSRCSARQIRHCARCGANGGWTSLERVDADSEKVGHGALHQGDRVGGR